MKFMILNGPNLQLLGTREPEVYGYETLADIEALCSTHAARSGIEIDFRQSNHEGDLVDWIAEAREDCQGIIINPAAYTHTSIALRDAISAVQIPAVEVHLSDIHAREPFRQLSYVKDVCIEQISGHGSKGYTMAIDSLTAHCREA